MAGCRTGGAGCQPAVTFAGGNQPDPSMELKNAASHRLVPVPAKLRAILDATPQLGGARCDQS